MRNIVLALLSLTAAVAAGEPDLPKPTYPVEGISLDSYSNVCQSIVRQLPDDATVLILEVYTTGKTIVATTAEPTGSQTNKVLHVFTNNGKNWKHTRSHTKGKSMFLGLTGADIQNLLALLQPHVTGNEQLLILRHKTEREVHFMTGGLGAPNAGKGDVFIFEHEGKKWRFKTKGKWRS